MKKILPLIFIFLCAFSVPTQQYTLTDDDVVVTDGVIKSCSYDFTLTDIIIPETLDGQTVTEIWGSPAISGSAFIEKGITSIVFPETLLKIGRYTFYKNALTEVVIPNSVTEIDTGAFSSNQLTSVTLSDNLKVLENQVFISNSLTSITIPEGVIEIEDYAFYSNSLASVSIPNSVTNIGESAFSSNSLTSITLPTVDITGFINWIDEDGNTYANGTEVTNLSTYYVAQITKTLTDDDVVVVDGIITSCTLNDTTTSITIPEVLDGQTIIGLGDSLFSSDALTAVNLPETVTTIGDRVFYNCNLTTITLPSTLTSIGEYAFGSNSLTEILLPETLTSIGKWAFDENSLTEVDIPGSVTKIEDNVFFRNYNLAKVTINEGVTFIGDNAFGYCYDLTDLSIPNTVTYIGENAFNNISGLPSFTLPTPTKTGYSVNWTDSNAIEYATGATVTDKAASYTANFEINTYVISGIVTGADGVSLTLSGDVEETQTVTTSGDTFSFSVEYNRSVVLTASKLGYLFDTEEYSFPNIYGDKTETNFVASINEELNTYVPDDNFEQALIDLGYDDVLNDYVLTDNINTITSLNVSSKSIADLTGIEDFVALSQLYCYSNQLTSLDVSANTALTALFCGLNQLTNLDVSTNIKLTNLRFESNQLTSIDLSLNTALTFLQCHDNLLESLDVSLNTALTYLYSNSNKFTSIDLSNNTVLRGLSLRFNQLTSLDVSSNTALDHLYCNDNQLTSLDVSTNTALNYLNCYSNQLTRLNVANGINTILTSFSAYNNPDLTCIQVDDADWSTTNWTDIDTQSYFNEESCYTYVPDDNFEQALIELGYDTALDDYVLTENINAITSLDVTSKNIADLTGIEDFVALTNLNCYSNALTSLDVSNNLNLNSLQCYYNKISTLDLSANTLLQTLYCGDNLLTTLDVSLNTVLVNLGCTANQLTTLDLSSNLNLRTLGCPSNNLTSLDVSANTALTSLNCSSNALTSLDVANGNNSNFTKLWAFSNPDLTCIQVDDAEWSTTNWTGIDDTASFSENCPRTLTWTGVTSSDWSTGSNWNLNTTPPIATDNVIINNVATAPILNHSVTINNLTIDTSASLNINTGKSLTINNDISNNGSLIINSDENNSGSFIVKGIATGEKITYNRFVTDQWHLIASPLNEQGIASFVTDASPNNQIAISSKGNYGLATYNNNGTAWNYYTSATLSGNFETGKGYTLKRNINGIVSFKGYLKTEDTEVNIAQAANNWNLIGNPYPSYISVNDFLDENGSIGSSSLSDLNEAIYLWDATENSGLGGYVPKNYSDSYKISPGQGFFVNAGSNTTVKFKESMQSSETTSFARSQNDGFQIKLQITDGEKVKSTRIKYLKAATKNFDTGYDAGIFTGESTNFNIYTSLIDNSTNSKLALQCLPINDLENTIVPIGLNSSKKEITFSINLENSPSSIKVFLEDRLLNTFKRLDEVNSFYKITLTDDVSRTGRFYIHTTQSSLYIDDNQTFNPINVYEFGNSTLKITGLENNKLELKIFSTLGQQIIDTSFKPNDIKEISLPQINTGIYIVQMITESGILSKKIKLN